MILMPLLGLQHVLVLVEPGQTGACRFVITIVNAILVSSQVGILNALNKIYQLFLAQIRS